MTHFSPLQFHKSDPAGDAGISRTNYQEQQGPNKVDFDWAPGPRTWLPSPSRPSEHTRRPLTSIISINIVGVPRESRSIFNGPDIRLSEKLCLISMLKVLPEQSAPHCDPSVGRLSSALPALRVSLLRFLCLLMEANNIPQSSR